MTFLQLFLVYKYRAIEISIYEIRLRSFMNETISLIVSTPE